MSMSNSEKTVKDIPRTTDILLLSIYAPLRAQRFPRCAVINMGGIALIPAILAATGH